MWEFERSKRRQRTALTGFLGALLFAVIVLGNTHGVVATFEKAARATGQALFYGYRAAPALMLGMIMLGAVPLLALIAFFGFGVEFTHDRPRAPDREEGEGIEDALSDHAYLELIGATDGKVAILRDMLRIGREDDNDVRIRSEGVNRYHAAIYREDFGDYAIADLSGDGGTGLLVNGARCRSAHLHDGDVIELGPGRLRFHAGLV